MGTHKNYVDYLRHDPRWQAARWAAFRRDNGRCRVCKRNLLLCSYSEEDAKFDVHHVNYKFLGRELESEEALASVITICRACHEKVHGRKFDRTY